MKAIDVFAASKKKDESSTAIKRLGISLVGFLA